MPYDQRRIIDTWNDFHTPPFSLSSLITCRMEKDLPKYLYRYDKRHFAEPLIRTGRLRLGTLFEYKDSAHLGDAVADRYEGTHTFLGRRPDGVGIAATIVAYNAWIWCLSEVCDPDFLRTNAFGEKDCIIRIEAAGFFRRLCRYMAIFSPQGSLRQVQYLEPEDLDLNINLGVEENRPFPQFVKPAFERYRAQREWRLLFDPRDHLSQQRRDQNGTLPSDMPGVAIGYGVDDRLYDRALIGALPLRPRIIPQSSLGEFCEIVHG